MRVLLLYLFMFAFVPCHAQTYEQYMSSRLKVRGLDSVITCVRDKKVFVKVGNLNNF